MAESKTEIGAVQVAPAALVDLVRFVAEGVISIPWRRKSCRDVRHGRGSQAQRPKGDLRRSATRTPWRLLAGAEGNPQPVADYRAGKEAALSSWWAR